MFLLLFGGIWATVGLFITTVFILVGGPPWDDWILDERAQQTQAEPLGVHGTNARLNRVRVQEIEYRFVDRGGASHTARSRTVDGALIAAARAKQSVTIDYDPACPERTRLHGARMSFFGVFLLLPLGFGVVGLGLLGIALTDMIRRRRVYVRGDVARGRVDKVRQTIMRHNRRMLHRVTYTFAGPTGEQSGSFTTVDPPSEGAALWILYDPSDPKRSLPA